MGSQSKLMVLVCCLVAASAAEAGAPSRTVTIAPGAGYRAGWFHNFFLGEHWRDTWTTPIEVPVLNLDVFDGGLRPDRRGGGLETTNLHFKSANGNTWAFRSVDKDPGKKLLDPDTQDSWIGDLFKDEVSSAQPYGALMVPPLLDAANVLHSTPQLAVLPEDPRLGDFQQYAGMLGLLEERIERGIEGATMISDTLTLFQRLEQRSDEWVDARAYLRARLIDILVGDWDRHVLQWRWARFEQDGKRPGRAGRRRTRVCRRRELVEVAHGIRGRRLAGSLRRRPGLPVRLGDQGHRRAFGRGHQVLSPLGFQPVRTHE